MKAATKRGSARATRTLDPASPREMDPAVREAARAVMEAMAGFLLAVAAWYFFTSTGTAPATPTPDSARTSMIQFPTVSASEDVSTG